METRHGPRPGPPASPMPLRRQTRSPSTRGFARGAACRRCHRREPSP